MVAENFPAALAFTLVEEGGNDDDPHDHGGRTSRGVTQREWDAWRAAHAGNDWPQDVWQAPQDQIEALYKAQYWAPYCDRMPAGLDLEYFDFSVNAGRTQATRTLQKTLDVAVDGMMGVITWGAVEKCDVPSTISLFADNRSAFYHALKQFSLYGKGWITRTQRCEVAAAKLAAPSKLGAGYPVPKVSPKADGGDLRQPPVTPQTGTVVAGGSAGLGGILATLHDELAPLVGSVKYIEYALAAISIAGFALTLYGFWHQAQTKQLAG